MTNGDHEADDVDALGVSPRQAMRYRTEERYALMEWTQESDEIFTLIMVDYRCKVWPVHQFGGWGAMISHAGLASASYNFTTRADAQTWCEQQVAQL